MDVFLQANVDLKVRLPRVDFHLNLTLANLGVYLFVFLSLFGSGDRYLGIC